MTVVEDPSVQPTNRNDPKLAPIKGIPVIDVDTHLTEPGDLWTSRAPEKFKDLVPRVALLQEEDFAKRAGWRPRQVHEGGTPAWIVGDDTCIGFAGGASVVNKSNHKVKGSDFIHWPLTDVSPAASLTEPRLALMDDVGIWGQILYPNAVGFGGQGLASVADPELRMLIFTIWNDTMAEMQEQSNGRLMGMGLIPWWDIDLAVKEVERCHGMGLKGVNTNADPQNQGFPDLSDKFYSPLWDACEDLDVPVNFHVGASVSQASSHGPAPWPSLNNDARLAIGTCMLYLSNARIMANLIYSGMLDRHKKLKLVSVESGIGWIPFMLTALDYQAEENGVDYLELKPSEYFRRQMYSCFWFEGEGDPNFTWDADQLTPDNIMFESDFPHPTCLYPSPLDGIASIFKDHDVPWEDREKILGGTAARVFNIDMPKTVTH
mgnify:FL=1